MLNELNSSSRGFPCVLLCMLVLESLVMVRFNVCVSSACLALQNARSDLLDSGGG